MTITVGNHNLAPESPGQVISIFGTSTGGDFADAMNFVALVADGGPSNELTGPGTIVGPTITSVNIIGRGMLFGQNNTGQGDETLGLFGPQGASGVTTTRFNSIPVPAGKVLIGTITVSMVGSGFPSEGHDLVWDLNLGGSNNATSHFLTDFDPTFIYGVDLTIIDGTISIPFIPEPSSVVLGALALIGLGGVVTLRGTRTPSPKAN